MASEEGVDHQEAHFRPALLLRGIPADLDPASEGRAVLRPKAGAGFCVLRKEVSRPSLALDVS